MSANRVKAANSKLTAEWKRNNVTPDDNNLEKKLFQEGSRYDENKLFNGKTLRQIADELKKEELENSPAEPIKDEMASDIDLAGKCDSTNNPAE